MSLKNVERWLARGTVAVPILYAIYLAAAMTLVFSVNRQGLLSKEEASSAFVNPAFLQFRLQHHLFGTNFYAYVYFWLTSHISHSLFYGRFAKAAWMAFLPGFLYLYLRKRFEFPGSQAFAGALAIGILPGVLSFSWLGIDIGMETAIGCAALWLALFDSPAAILASCLLAALSAGCYGAGIVFLIAVGASQLLRLRRPANRPSVLAGFAVMFLALLIPALWWTNAQTLIEGGAGGPQFSNAATRLLSLGKELFIRGDSYYLFDNGAPALGAGLIGLLAMGGLLLAMFRDARRAWPLLLICAASVVVYAVAGNVIGVRRAIPLVISLGIFATLLLGRMAASRLLWMRVTARVAFAAWLIIGAYEFNAERVGLASARIAVPTDFDFRVPPGETMASTVSKMLDGTIPVPADWSGYEPDRTLCILFVLGEPAPKYSPSEIIAQCDKHGWSIPSNAPRFARYRRHFL
jgi:hypothetical protein